MCNEDEEENCDPVYMVISRNIIVCIWSTAMRYYCNAYNLTKEYKRDKNLLVKFELVVISKKRINRRKLIVILAP